ncbi:MAG: phospho-sugar mutase [Lachnospiraceae bacterium]|nr:phospho-sugar mutase [Lachnospiraceae bacterium]
MDYREIYEKWRTDPYFSEEIRRELEALEGNEAEIEDRFYRQLSFGTGGLRGMLGAGTNRMNIYTVRQATQGLANYILAVGKAVKGVAIAYDSRKMSPEFAQEAALCLNANGIRTYLFESLRPTPELSFAVRHLGCVAGIVVTASHNPREYNGYKVYWEDGAQILPPHDKNIMEEVKKVSDYAQIKTMDEETARERGLYSVIGSEVDDLYMEQMKRQSIHPEIIREMAADIRVLYTPLHGSGNLPVRRALRELGFTQVFVVPEQEKPDGAFPTVAYPNPEDENAWKLALKLAREVDADLVLATDPDADRLGAYVKDRESGDYVSLTGNMSGTLMADYILRERTKLHRMPENPALVETIVTTDMVKAVAKAYGVALLETLTGFKYIGEQIRLFEENHSHQFLFGMEESYGCLAGTYARDKDACVAVTLLCEVAAYYKKQGKTLWDAMVELYERYGFYKEGLATVTLKGIDGARQIQERMRHLREAPPETLGGYKVLAVRDYQADRREDRRTGAVTATGLPTSNVLYYELEDNAWCCVRPSGTEPKIKYYFGVKGDSVGDAQEKLERLKRDLLEDASKI